MRGVGQVFFHSSEGSPPIGQEHHRSVKGVVHLLVKRVVHLLVKRVVHSLVKRVAHPLAKMITQYSQCRSL